MTNFVTSCSLDPEYRGYSVDDLWNKVFQPVANIVEDVVNDVESRGVNVFKEVTFDQFGKLVPNFKVVTLVAHWRSAFFHDSDFVEPQRVLNRILCPTDSVTRKIKSDLGCDWIQRLQKSDQVNDPERKQRKLLRDAFNEVIQNKALFQIQPQQEDATVGFLDCAYRGYLNRDFLDAAFPSEITPGNRVEFEDGLYTIADVIEIIPEDFGGTLDFTVCNSALIGNILKRHRQYRIIVNEQPAGFGRRMLIYKGIIELLTRTPMEYAEACATIHQALRHVDHSRSCA